MIKYVTSLFSKKRVYLDYAAATPVLPSVQKVMIDAMRLVGNPSSIHSEGVEAMRALSGARVAIARELACKSRDIVFTGGGTESNNLAILGTSNLIAARSNLADRQRGSTSLKELAGTHWIVSAIEHPSVLECFSEIEGRGGDVTFIDPDGRGIISPDKLGLALRPETVFISVGWANGEIGIVQPIQMLVATVRAYEKKHNTKIIFHTDAGQAPLYKATHVHSLDVDLMTLDSTKLYGPRGCAVLYIASDTDLKPVVHGGSQERSLRPGTENIAAILGFAQSLKTISLMRLNESKRIEIIRDSLLQRLSVTIPGLISNTYTERSLPHMLNISLPHIQSEYLTLALDANGISISTKSACREGDEQKSHVVNSLGGPHWRAKNTLRMSLGIDTTVSDIARVAQIMTMLYLKQKDISND